MPAVRSFLCASKDQSYYSFESFVPLRTGYTLLVISKFGAQASPHHAPFSGGVVAKTLGCGCIYIYLNETNSSIDSIDRSIHALWSAAVAVEVAGSTRLWPRATPAAAGRVVVVVHSLHSILPFQQQQQHLANENNNNENSCCNENSWCESLPRW